MFKKTINKPHLIILKNEKPVYIHTFFCRFPIDIFFLNIKKTVIDIKRNVKPWTFIGKTVPSAYIIETKSGLLLDINVHDTITWEQ